MAAEEADYRKAGQTSSEGFEKGPGTGEEVWGKPAGVDGARQRLATLEGEHDMWGRNFEQNLGRTASTQERRETDVGEGEEMGGSGPLVLIATNPPKKILKGNGVKFNR